MRIGDDNQITSGMLQINKIQGPGQIASMNLVGSVQGKNAIIIDDMIDTAGTLCEAAKALKSHGANHVYAFATHGIFHKYFQGYLMAGRLKVYRIRCQKKLLLLTQCLVNRMKKRQQKFYDFQWVRENLYKTAPLLAESIMRI